MHLENIAVIGYLGKDPTQNQVNGKTVCNFSVGATNARTKKTTWYRVAAWGALGDLCMKYLKVGKAVYAQGDLELVEWQKEGISDKQLQIQARTVQFLSPQDARQDAPQRHVPQSADLGYGPPMYDRDEIPF
jgi:single stranded DNA-binding protein